MHPASSGVVGMRPTRSTYKRRQSSSGAASRIGMFAARSIGTSTRLIGLAQCGSGFVSQDTSPVAPPPLAPGAELLQPVVAATSAAIAPRTSVRMTPQNSQLLKQLENARQSGLWPHSAPIEDAHAPPSVPRES